MHRGPFPFPPLTAMVLPPIGGQASRPSSLQTTGVIGKRRHAAAARRGPREGGNAGTGCERMECAVARNRQDCAPDKHVVDTARPWPGVTVTGMPEKP